MSLKSFLNPAKINAAIKEVKALAKAAHVHVALAGGVALQWYGSDRFTQDVDFVADGYITALQTGGRSKGVLTFGGTKAIASNGVPIDLIVRDDQYAELYDAALEHASMVHALGVPVVPLRYLGAMKLAAGRGKDLADLQFILLDAKINYTALRGIVKNHLGPYAADELDSIKQVATWERKGRK